MKNWASIKNVHLTVGVVVFIVFLITGRMMRWDFPDKEIISQEFRLLMRSRHIYILFSGLIHLALGFYLAIHPQIWRKYLQYFGSILLIFGSALLIFAFYHETYRIQGFSEVSRFGIYLNLGGIMIHLLSNIGAKVKLNE